MENPSISCCQKSELRIQESTVKGDRSQETGNRIKAEGERRKRTTGDQRSEVKDQSPMNVINVFCLNEPMTQRLKDATTP
jgi:hypothetical protein